MSQQAAKRRRKQAANNYTHLHSTVRPHYKKRICTIAQSIENARRVAARMAAISSKKR